MKSSWATAKTFHYTFVQSSLAIYFPVYHLNPDYSADVRSLSVVPLGFEAIRKAILEARARGTRFRFITEITQENISYVKEFIESVELRHLDGVKPDGPLLCASVPDGFVELGKEILVIVVVSLTGQNTKLERQRVTYAKLFSIDLHNR